MAEPGRRRPTIGEALHLLASGLRQRFRLPAGRPLAVIAAVLVAVTMGAFGAAAGSWVGAQTLADLPGDAELDDLARRVRAVEGESHRATVITLGFGPRSERTVTVTGEVGRNWDAEQARRRWVADGWSVSPITPLGVGYATDPETGAVVEESMRAAGFQAESGGLVFQLRGFIGAEEGSVNIDGWARRTAAFLPSIVVGVVVGLVGGWLLAAAFAYRIRRAPAGRRRAAAGLCAAALLALLLPSLALYFSVMRAFQGAGDDGAVTTVHSTLAPARDYSLGARWQILAPGEYYPFGPPWQLLALSAAGIVIAAVAILLARPGARSEPREDPVAG